MLPFWLFTWSQGIRIFLAVALAKTAQTFVLKRFLNPAVGGNVFFDFFKAKFEEILQKSYYTYLNFFFFFYTGNKLLCLT